MYGLSSTRQDPTICLRCLARAGKPARYYSSKVLQLKPAYHLGQRAGLKEHETSLYDASSQAEKPNFKPKRIDLSSQQVQLGVKSLGEPAQIRIVRERKQPREKTKQHVDKETGSKLRVKITAEQERQTFTELLNPQDPDDYKNGIESIKEQAKKAKKKQGDLDSQQCASLVNQLVQGFTYSQLNTYLPDNIAAWKTNQKEDFKRFYESKELNRSRWFAGKSSFPATAKDRVDSQTANNQRDVFFVHKASDSKTKVLLAENIVRKCWLVRSREEKAFGELDIKFKDQQYLEVLLKNSAEVFESRSKHFMVNIQISLSDGIVRLSGEYGQATDVFKLICGSVESISKKHCVLPESVKKLQVLPQYFEELENLTNTKVFLGKSGATIWHMGMKSEAVSDARRLLLQAASNILTPVPRVLFNDSHTKAEPILSRIFSTTTPSLHERLFEWSRIQHPVTTQVEQSKDTDKTLELSKSTPGLKKASLQVRSLLQSVLPVQGPPSPSFTSDSDLPMETSRQPNKARVLEYWQSEPSLSVSAQVGYSVTAPLLMTEPSPTKSTKPRKTSPSTKSKELSGPETSQSFLPGVPSLATHFSTLPALDNPRIYSSITIRLRPDSLVGELSSLDAATASAILPYFPSLTLTVALNSSTRTTKLTSATLVTQQRTVDLLLPNFPADVRFSAQQIVQANLHVLDPSIRQFLHNSNFNIWNEGKLNTPSTLDLKVPTFALGLDKSTNGKSKGDGAGLKAKVTDKLRAVKAQSAGILYRFEGLEVSSTIQRRLPAGLDQDVDQIEGLKSRKRIEDKENCHTANLSTVEAGLARGRWWSVEFSMNDSAGPQTLSSQEQSDTMDWGSKVKSFVRSVAGFVAELNPNYVPESPGAGANEVELESEVTPSEDIDAETPKSRA